VQSSFPILAVRGVNDVEIEDLLVDGNLTENMEMYIDGCRNGAIYFHEGKDHAVRRCVFRANTIEDNGGLHPPGVGFDLNHPARGTVLEDNLVRDTRPAGQRSQTIALRLHPKSEPAKVADSNGFEGAVQKEETQDR
jgi:hypothetical protein